MEDLFYSIKKTPMSEILIASTGEYLYIDYLNELSFNFVDGANKVQITDLETDEAVIVNRWELSDDCPQEVSSEEGSNYDPLSYAAFKKDKDETAEFVDKLNGLLELSEVDYMTYESYELLQEYLKSERQILLSKNDMVRYDITKYDIVLKGHYIDYDKYMVVEEDGDKIKLVDFAKANLWEDAKTLVDIVKNNAAEGIDDEADYIDNKEELIDDATEMTEETIKENKMNKELREKIDLILGEANDDKAIITEGTDSGLISKYYRLLYQAVGINTSNLLKDSSVTPRDDMFNQFESKDIKELEKTIKELEKMVMSNIAVRKKQKDIFTNLVKKYDKDNLR